MEVVGNTPNPREPGRGGNRSGIGPGGLIFELFGRIFWLLGRPIRLSRKPIQAGARPCCRLSCRALGLSNNMHYVK
jgi:hypothetical protein